MRTCSVERHFPAGHRILGLRGQGEKCRNIHGHNWVAKWIFESPVNEFPPPVEFGVLKSTIDHEIIQRVDHGFFVHEQDDFIHYLRTNMLRHTPMAEPPTTEAIAQWLGEQTIAIFSGEQKAQFITGDSVMETLKRAAGLLRSVEVQEGPYNSATWTREPVRFAQGGLIGGSGAAGGFFGTINNSSSGTLAAGPQA